MGNDCQIPGNHVRLATPLATGSVTLGFVHADTGIGRLFGQA